MSIKEQEDLDLYNEDIYTEDESYEDEYDDEEYIDDDDDYISVEDIDEVIIKEKYMKDWDKAKTSLDKEREKMEKAKEEYEKKQKLLEKEYQDKRKFWDLSPKSNLEDKTFIERLGYDKDAKTKKEGKEDKLYLFVDKICPDKKKQTVLYTIFAIICVVAGILLYIF